MKVLIGITSSPEEAVEAINKDYSAAGGSTIAGPFSSVEIANEWIRFMRSRDEALEQITLPGGSRNDSPLYGIVYQPVDI